jgi:non-canonical (house-cleaning) NTP pyrophosphatase
MRIAIGSSRATEIKAVKEAWKVFCCNILDDLNEPAEFFGYDVPNELSDFPRSVEDLMRGARGRVENLMLQLKREKAEAEFYIGLEGGFSIVNSQGPKRLVFLESWAYVSDGHRGSFGHGGGVCVPAAVANPAIDRGIQLGIVLDRFKKDKGIESDQGPWGSLTRDILNAQHSFVIALITAFAPFYNPEAFS